MTTNKLTAIVALLAISLGTTGPAVADPCGMVPPPPQLEIATSATIERIGVQKTFVAHDRGVETMVLRPGFQGNVEEFGMLIPFPSPPAIRKVDDNIFSHIAAAIDPPEVIARVQRFRNRPMARRSMAGGAKSAPAMDMAEAEAPLRFDEVRVVKQEAVGMYEVAVLAAGSPKALKRWMDDNTFRYPEGMDEVVHDYVRSKWFFVAVKTKVGDKSKVNPHPGMRNANARRPAGSTFSGFVQAMGFRFETKKLVVPMRLSVFNAEGNSRNIVYVLTKGGQKIQDIPESFVVRQIPGKRLMRNVTDPLPLRVIGGTKADLNAFQVSQLPARRDPTPHNGLAKELFGADMVAMQKKRLASPLEEKEKALLNIGESLGLRGRVIDDLNRAELKKERDRLGTQSLKRLQGMTMTVIDGAFDRNVLAKQNLGFKRHRMAAARNTKAKYDAIRQGPVGNMGGKLYLWQVSSLDKKQQLQELGDSTAFAAVAGGGNGGGGNSTLPLALALGLFGFVAFRSRKRVLYPVAVAGALIVASTNLAFGQSSSLAKKLAGDNGAQLAESLAAKGDKSVAELLDVARTPGNPVAQGRAIMALSEVGSTMADAGLALLASSSKQTALVRTWAAAGRMQVASTTEDLLALEGLSRSFPATRRPFVKRFRALVSTGSANDILSAVSRVPELRAEMQSMMQGLPAKKLLEVMMNSNDQQARQFAASNLGTKKASTVSKLIVKELRFNKRAKEVPWQGGPLFMPGIAWPKKDAKAIASDLLRWMIWAEKNNDSQGARVAANNLMNQSLAKAAGYKSVSGQLGYSTVFWIGLWTKTYGSKEANRIMKDTD
jgi:hypothetical protein